MSHHLRAIATAADTALDGATRRAPCVAILLFASSCAAVGHAQVATAHEHDTALATPPSRMQAHPAHAAQAQGVVASLRSQPVLTGDTRPRAAAIVRATMASDGEDGGYIEGDVVVDMGVPSAALRRRGGGGGGGGKAKGRATTVAAAAGGSAAATGGGEASGSSGDEGKPGRRGKRSPTAATSAPATTATTATTTASPSAGGGTSGGGDDDEGSRTSSSHAVYARIEHDVALGGSANWLIGHTDRFLGTVETPFTEFLRVRDDVTEGIPLHRIVHFRHIPTGALVTRANKYRELPALAAVLSSGSAAGGEEADAASGGGGGGTA